MSEPMSEKGFLRLASVICVAVVAVVAIHTRGEIEKTKLKSEADKIHAEQEIEHDKSRPRKVWEKDPK